MFSLMKAALGVAAVAFIGLLALAAIPAIIGSLLSGAAGPLVVMASVGAVLLGVAVAASKVGF
jgi:hypothetical protein